MSAQIAAVDTQKSQQEGEQNSIPHQERRNGHGRHADPAAALMRLEEAAHNHRRDSFSRIIDTIDWSTYQADQLLTVIDLALSLDMSKLAMELAALGGARFPDYARMQSAAKVLAPPVVRVVKRDRRKPSSKPSTAWLRDNAHEYHGQWVAVQNGKLLKAAQTLDELDEVIDAAKDTQYELGNVVVTRVF